MNSFLLSIWRLLPLFIASLIASKTFADTIHYESHLQREAAPPLHYYLTDQIEEYRRVFYLFLAEGSGLQDLVERKSFALTDNNAADQWLQDKLKTHQLQRLSTIETPFSEPIFYPFSQLNYFKTEPPSSSNWDLETKPQASISSEDAVLWTAKNEWSLRWEAEYGRWVRQTLTPRFMIDIQLPTDCADVAYTLRWIFAHIHKLPMATRLGGSKQLFTNETVKPEWLKLPTDPDWKKDRRFRAALQFLLRNTYTHTLMQDSYPVAINPEALTPGTHHLRLYKSSGHTMIVDKVNEPDNLPITLLFSTLPIQIRELIPTFFQDHDVPELSKSGFYKIRWAKKTEKGWSIISSKAIPGYSEEQFSLGADDVNNHYFIKVYKKLNPQFSFEVMLNHAFQELQERVKDRIQAVEDGYRYCQANDCSPGSPGDEDWSTPNRDQRLLQLHNSINLASSFIEPKAIEKWKKIIANVSTEKTYSISGQLYSLNQIILALVYQFTQTDPRLNVAQRWGLSPTEGYGAVLIQNLKNKIQERNTLIQKAEECRLKHCNETDGNFKKLNTIAIDHFLSHLWTGAQNLCQSSGAEDCQSLKQILQSQSFGNHNYFELYSQSPTWISNPNAPIPHRWGQHGRMLGFITDSSSNIHSAYFTKNHEWFTMNHSLYKTSDLTQVALSNAEKMGQLHFQLGYYFTFERQEDQLIIRFYNTPQQPLAKITLKESKTEPLRLWWSSPSKGTLSVFSGSQFYEIDPLKGNLLQHKKITRFFELPADHRITIIETTQGLLMSDAEVDASSFSAFPLSLDDAKSVTQVNRTERGWAFHSPLQFVYVESNSKTLIRWETNPNTSIFIHKKGQWALRSQGTTTHVYQKDPQSKDPLSSFQLVTTFDKGLRGLSESYFTISDGKQSSTYKTETLKPVQFQCRNKTAMPFILSDEYYHCLEISNQGPPKRELYHISHKFLSSSSGFSWWYFLKKFNTEGSPQWVSVDKYLFGTTNSSFSYSEITKITPQALEATPSLQTLSQDHQEIMTHLPLSPIPMEKNPTPAGVAPPPLLAHEKTNFGLSKWAPVAKSLVLKASSSEFQSPSYLFLPNPPTTP